MKVYKIVNLNGGNLKDRFIAESKINDVAKEGWTLINITTPPNSENNKWVTGVFVRDFVPVQAPKETEENVPVESPKRGPGRPPRVVELAKE